MRQERDPVCGMMVETAHAPAESHHAGHTYYFCSENCRLRFDADPIAYSAGGAPSDVERHEPPRTTTGGLTAPKFGSAGSGGAELEPGPEQHTDRTAHDNRIHKA